MSWRSPNETKLGRLAKLWAPAAAISLPNDRNGSVWLGRWMCNGLVVFGVTKLEMRMLERLAKHLEHINEKLFCSVLLDRVRGRMHPCCFGNETGIRSDPSVAWIADNTAHMLRTPRAVITAKATNCVGFWYRLLAVVGEDVSKVHCWSRALRSNEFKLSHGSRERKGRQNNHANRDRDRTAGKRSAIGRTTRDETESPRRK